MAKMDLNSDDEKVNIETIFWSAMDMLSDDDKKLPQVSILYLFLSSHIAEIYYVVTVSTFYRRSLSPYVPGIRDCSWFSYGKRLLFHILDLWKEHFLITDFYI